MQLELAPINPNGTATLVPLLRQDDEQQMLTLWRELKDEHGDKLNPKLVKTVVRNRLRRIQREKAASELRNIPISSGDTGADTPCLAVEADFRDVLRLVPPASVEAIITDPPYGREYLPLYSDLAELAARILKPGGQLVVMSGQSYLPEVYQRLSEHLDYRWTGAYLTPGPQTRMHHAKVGTGWKPILFFQRRNATGLRFLMSDVFTGDGDDKRYHRWGQSEFGFEKLVSTVTRPGDIVIDPFLGGGTTAVVCQRLGRRFLGCDNDAGAVRTSIARLSAASLPHLAFSAEQMRAALPSAA